MQKRNGRGRASLRELDLRRLLTCAISDISGTIDDGSLGALTRALMESKGENFRSVLDEQLRNAESGLASGGASQYIALRQLQGLLKKLPEWHAVGKESRELAAYTKFELSELKCKLTNKRLSYARSNWSRTKRYRSYAEILSRASLIAQELLGPLDHDAEYKILEECRFGSGATFSHSRESSSLYYKLSGEHTATVKALPMLREWMARSPAIHKLVSDHPLSVVEGNRLSFVPKDWDIDRTIAAEPSWNILLQLGVGGYLARRVKRYGIELSNQQKGWYTAREGSICSSHATMDLSSASDTVSEELVKWLIPGEWYELLDALRSPSYSYKGSWHRYHKFSSMGNGFTFPLESIIFWSLAKATASYHGLDASTVTVYGDDIVVPVDLFAVLAEVLRFSGFEANLKKSFAFGHFRETCGRDFLQGVNIRPVYLRGRPKNVEDVYSLYNRLYTFSLVPLPHTLAYLLKCVNKPHFGPGILGRSDTTFDDDYGWKSKGRRFESYFFDDCPKSRYDADLQSYSWQTIILDRKMAVDHKATDEYVRYLCFLTGIEGGKIYHASRVKWFERRYKTTYWPDLLDVRRIGLEYQQLML